MSEYHQTRFTTLTQDEFVVSSKKSAPCRFYILRSEETFVKLEGLIIKKEMEGHIRNYV